MRFRHLKSVQIRYTFIFKQIGFELRFAKKYSKCQIKKSLSLILLILNESWNNLVTLDFIINR